jgi:chromosome segregation ATPase
METLYVWLLIFAGATMIVLGILFLAAERELGKKRRELEKLRRNQRRSEAQGSETNPSAELMTRNKELVETISSLSAQLEESKRTVEELQSEKRQLVSAGELKQQLQASQETIKELEAEQQHLLDQLRKSESLLSKTASQYKEVADRDLQLESELAESRQQMDKLMMKNNELLEMTNSLSSKLAARERTVEELQIIQDRLPGIECDNQRLRSVTQELQEEIANVKTQLGTTESRFSEAGTQAREIAEHNSKFQTEVGELNHQLQTSQKTIKELEVEQQHLGSKGDIQIRQRVCPKCSSDDVERVSRIGSERLISLFYIYPFRCQPCGHRFRLLQWGVTYRKIETPMRWTEAQRMD